MSFGVSRPKIFAKIKGVPRDYGEPIAAIASGRLYTQGKACLLDDVVYVSNGAEQGMRDYKVLPAFFYAKWQVNLHHTAQESSFKTHSGKRRVFE